MLIIDRYLNSDLDAAEEYFLKALNINTNLFEAWIGLGQVSVLEELNF